MGALALSVAAFLAVRLCGASACAVAVGGRRYVDPGRGPRRIEPDLAAADPRQEQPEPDGSSGSAVRRLLGRAQDAWESGALWVAFVIGFWAGPNPSLVMFALTTILTSGAAIGMQIGGRRRIRR